MRVRIISFGHLHGERPAEAHVTVDLRTHFRDPHFDRELTQLTGEDPRVVDAVLTTPGFAEAIDAGTAAVRAFASGPVDADMVVAAGCGGGRHRAYVYAVILAQLLDAEGYEVVVEHRDVHRPVVERTATGERITAAAVEPARDNLPAPITGAEADGQLREDLQLLAPAATAALQLLADAISKRAADHDDVVEAIKAAGLHEAFAKVFEAAADSVWARHDAQGGDPYDLDVRLTVDNLSGAAGDVRRAFTWI
ncbi:hypothetical protein ACGF07_31945 [Kitasatospora sp. NPDC048194]|uniref:RapZ C-terminal domain-containing protein n=1 Tax=Kitasatospora sp. NPDC048194 TaxID=3364045 RepID=UPI00372351A4